MTKFYNSKIMKGLLFLISYLGVFCFIYNNSVRFNWVYTRYLNIKLSDGFLVFFIFLGIASFLLMVYSIYKSTTTEKPFETINKIDFLLIASIAILILLALFVIIVSNYSDSFLLAIVPILFYLVSVIVVITFVYRIRDKTLMSTIFLSSFYKMYPLKTKVGLVCTTIFLINIIFIFFKGLVFIKSNFYLDQIDLLELVMGVITVGGIVYLIIFLVNLKKSYENEIIEKMKAEKFKTELITNVSHDIRTPLTSIITYVDLIKQLKIENTELNDYTNILEKKTNRLKVLINDLMEASKAKTGNINVNIQRIDLIEIIGQIIGEFDSEFSKRELDLVFTFSEKKLLIWADGKLLWRVLENIFSNLLKYSMESTRIYCNIFVLENNIKLSFVNISKEALNITAEELTMQFTRSDKARNTEGSGLGLYIIEALTELMNCDFNIRIIGDSFESNFVFEKCN